MNFNSDSKNDPQKGQVMQEIQKFQQNTWKKLELKEIRFQGQQTHQIFARQKSESFQIKIIIITGSQVNRQPHNSFKTIPTNFLKILKRKQIAS